MSPEPRQATKPACQAISAAISDVAPLAKTSKRTGNITKNT